jgi:hypothetical protein
MLRPAATVMALLLALGAGAAAEPLKTGAGDGAQPPRKWKKGDRSTPHERETIAQEVAAFERSRLVSVRAIVAGADPIRCTRGRKDEERYLVSAEVARALGELRARVKADLGEDYELWLNGAFDSSGRAHKAHTLHKTGRAVDLDLYRRAAKGKGGDKVGEKVHVLAGLASEVFAAQVGADGRVLRAWIYDEGTHVHVSLESPSLTDAPAPAPAPAASEAQATK